MTTAILKWNIFNRQCRSTWCHPFNNQHNCPQPWFNLSYHNKLLSDRSRPYTVGVLPQQLFVNMANSRLLTI